MSVSAPQQTSVQQRRPHPRTSRTRSDRVWEAPGGGRRRCDSQRTTSLDDNDAGGGGCRARRAPRGGRCLAEDSVRRETRCVQSAVAVAVRRSDARDRGNVSAVCRSGKNSTRGLAACATHEWDPCQTKLATRGTYENRYRNQCKYWAVSKAASWFSAIANSKVTNQN